jgi:hypothetical protein
MHNIILSLRVLSGHDIWRQAHLIKLIVAGELPSKAKKLWARHITGILKINYLLVLIYLPDIPDVKKKRRGLWGSRIITGISKGVAESNIFEAVKCLFYQCHPLHFAASPGP